MTSHIHCNNGVVLSTCHFLHHERPVGTKDRAPISPITPISPTPPHPQVTTSSEGFPSTDTLQLGPSSSDPYNNLAICASQEKGRPDAVCAERERRAPTVRKSTARAASQDHRNLTLPYLRATGYEVGYVVGYAPRTGAGTGERAVPLRNCRPSIAPLALAVNAALCLHATSPLRDKNIYYTRPSCPYSLLDCVYQAVYRAVTHPWRCANAALCLRISPLRDNDVYCTRPPYHNRCLLKRVYQAGLPSRSHTSPA